MIQKGIIDFIASRTKITNRELIEKDLILHRLLLELSSSEYFSKNYAFKGGTCLMKCYLPYYRFSEDLDFTYINQKEFDGKSEKQKRKLFSDKINPVIEILKEACSAFGLDFKAVKSDRRYVELGGSNRQSTFKLWYMPDGSSRESFIKIQINFSEKIAYPITEKHADNFFFGKYEDFQQAFTLPENSEWILRMPSLKCYDIKEILLEKVRAILTRRGTKARDYIDIYMIEKKEGIDVRNFKKQVLEKVKPVLKFEKYKSGFGKRQKEEFTFNRKEEERILLIPLPEDFDNFFKKLKDFLEELSEELNEKTSEEN